MKTKLLGVMLLAGSSLFAETHFSIGIGVGGHGYAAPPVVAYAAPYPGDGYEWIDGYWYQDGPRRLWREGYWGRRSYGRGYAVAPRYDGNRYGRGYSDSGYNRSQSYGNSYNRDSNGSGYNRNQSSGNGYSGNRSDGSSFNGNNTGSTFNRNQSNGNGYSGNRANGDSSDFNRSNRRR